MMRRQQQLVTSTRSAFTLVEVLVVLFTVSLLAALLLPALAGARSQAQSVACQARLRQLALANIGYGMENNDFFVPAAADMWNNSGLRRWHGTRTDRNEPFEPSEGPLAAYLADGRVKECPAHIVFTKSDAWSDSFEKGCGGYGYNMAYIGSRLWDSRADFQQAYARTTSVHEVSNPAQTLMFADTAMAKDQDALIEYSFAEPPFAVMGGQVMAGMFMSPSIHFRHREHANVAGTDGHVGAEFMAGFETSNAYGVNSSVIGLGWLEPADNTPFDLH